jgi:glycosyltransferase involved in cell wall biosynthesis
LQYTPHAFGYKAMNLPFVMWLSCRAARMVPLWVMFHEVAFPFSWRPVKYALLATVHRMMARLLVGAASRIFISIPAWATLLRQFCPRLPIIEWLPVYSNLPEHVDPHAVAEIRHQLVPEGTQLIGHFGTYGRLLAPLLEGTLRRVAQDHSGVHFLLLGRGAQAFAEQLLRSEPVLAGRISARSDLPPAILAAHLRACDLLLQPYPDGVSTRRTTMMAGLALGVPIVTNWGPLSETLWQTGPLAVAASADPGALAEQVTALLNAPAYRTELARQAPLFYQTYFRLENTIAALQRRLCHACCDC